MIVKGGYHVRYLITINHNSTPLRYVHRSHHDLINSINAIKVSEILHVTSRHVKAHQHDYCIYKNLNWLEQRNADMDTLAQSLMFDRRRQKIKK